MARKVVAYIGFDADFTGVAKALGAAAAMMHFDENTQYVNDIVHAAWEEANIEFNETAAAFAGAGGPIKHMYEWGTAGINTGRTNRRPNPMSASARLWKPTMVGNGLDQNIDYIFKPSTAFVPKPTKRDTNMDPSVIAQMRDHVFWNKAMVMETGMTVTIAPVNAKLLLIPLQKDKIYYGARPHDIARGYMMTKGPVQSRPGARSVGRFQTFWTRFWSSRGNEILNNEVIEQLHIDFDGAIEKPRSGHMTPPKPGQIKKIARQEQRKVSAESARAARIRRKLAEEVNAQ